MGQRPLGCQTVFVSVKARARRGPGGVAAQQYPPDDLVGVDYYRPTSHGVEREIGGRLEKLRAIVRRASGRN